MRACMAWATCSTPSRSRRPLQAIYRHNFHARLGDLVNPCRVFGLDDEAGHVMASWPDPERKPAVPVPYAQETMHGMEYAFGQLLMLTAGSTEGVRVYRGGPGPLRRREAEPVERDRVRVQLRALDGELGRGRRAGGLRGRCRRRASRRSHLRCAMATSSRSFWSGPTGVRHHRASPRVRSTLDGPGRDSDALAPARPAARGADRPTAVSSMDGARAVAVEVDRALGEPLGSTGVTLMVRHAA